MSVFLAQADPAGGGGDGGSGEADVRRMVVFVPHRDYLGAFAQRARRLFAQGEYGAYSFPPVVPLRVSARPACAAELRGLSASLRAESLERGGVVALPPPPVWDGPLLLGPPCPLRNGAVANLALRPLKQGERGFSFEWKIGRLYWLPAYRAAQKAAAGPGVARAGREAGL